MPTDARGNYLPEPPYLRETETYHSQPLESIRHAGNYFVPLSIRPIFIFCCCRSQDMSNYLTTDGLKIFSLLPEAPLRPVAFATSGNDWMCAKSLNTEGSFAVKQISVDPRLRMGWQHDAAQICCWAPEPTDMDPNLQALWCRCWHSATNPLATVAAVNWWDRQTDTWLLH